MAGAKLTFPTCVPCHAQVRKLYTNVNPPAVAATEIMGFCAHGPITEMKNAGLKFRNDVETGPGGRQIQVEDPDGNPIELFEPASAGGKTQRSSQ